MCLNNLVDDCQPEPGAAFEAGLEGLEYFFHDLWIDPRTGVSKADLPVFPNFVDGDAQCPAFAHGANRVLAKIPKDLLDLVPVGQRFHGREGIATFDLDAGVL